MDLMELQNSIVPAVLIGIGVYSSLNVLSGIIDSAPFRRKIETQQELDLIVEEEAIKLGLDPTKIDAFLNADRNSASKTEDRYALTLKAGRTATRNTVRHELCHILEDCDSHTNFLYYLVIAEPRANLYATLGITTRLINH